MEITRADIDRIHERLDGIRDDQALMKTDLAVMKIKLETLPKPPILPARPCQYFQAHEAAHAKAAEESKKNWRDVVLAVAGPTLAGIGGAVATFLGISHLGKP